jgi:hypothetical protein
LFCWQALKTDLYGAAIFYTTYMHKTKFNSTNKNELPAEKPSDFRVFEDLFLAGVSWYRVARIVNGPTKAS